MTILSVKNVQKIYSTLLSRVQVEALKDISFEVQEGEFVAIMGESGSGKSTLLNIIATLDEPSNGLVLLNNQQMHHLNEQALSEFRRSSLGFIFQDFNLLSSLNVKDNILLPLVLSSTSHQEMLKKLEPITDKLSITKLLGKYPYEISGGEKQRVAIARALITNPTLILADEPTGSLDSKSANNLLKIFDDINKSGQTILMVTHSALAASHASRVLFIRDGQIFHQLYRGENSSRDFLTSITETLTVINTSESNE